MNKELLITLAAAAAMVAPAVFAQAAAPAAVEAVATVQKVCLPILRGGAVKASAQAGGFKLQDGGWVLPIAGKDEIDLAPPDNVNPHVCTLTITAAPGDAAAMRSALGTWAAAQTPPLAPVNVGQSPAGWVTSTWSGKTAAGAESVVLTQPQAAAPASATAAPAQSTLLVSLSAS